MIRFGTFIFILSILDITRTTPQAVPVPPMGWTTSGPMLSCDQRCKINPNHCISSDLISNVVFKLITEGYYSIGYKYIILTKCWASDFRDINSKIQSHRSRFPYGIKALSEFIHFHGLKLGLHFSREDNPNEPNLYKDKDFLLNDLDRLIEWGVDYVLFDFSYIKTKNFTAVYTEIANYFEKNAKRPIIIECNWPILVEFYHRNVDYTNIKSICQVWRSVSLTEPTWKKMQLCFSVLGTVQSKYLHAIGPGSWHLPSYLIGFEHGVSYKDVLAEMIMYAIYPAPLFIQDNILSLSLHFKTIYKHVDIININQDPLGLRGHLMYSDSDIEIWTRPLSGGKFNHYRYALAIVNKNPIEEITMLKSFQELWMASEMYFLKVLACTDMSHGFSVPTLNTAIVLNFTIKPSTVALLEANPRQNEFM